MSHSTMCNLFFLYIVRKGTKILKSPEETISNSQCTVLHFQPLAEAAEIRIIVLRTLVSIGVKSKSPRWFVMQTNEPPSLSPPPSIYSMKLFILKQDLIYKISLGICLQCSIHLQMRLL